MPESILTHFAGMWLCPLNWFEHGKLRPHRSLGLGVYHAIVFIAERHGCKIGKEPIIVPAEHVTAGAIARVLGGEREDRVTRVLNAFRADGFLRNNDDGSVHLMTATATNPVTAKRQAWESGLATPRKHESRKVPGTGGEPAGNQREPQTETEIRDPRSEIDPEHASHALVAVATPDALDDDEQEALQLEAEDTRPRKANPFYETALDVAQLHAVVFKLPGKPTREAMKPLLRCLGRNVGMTAWDCRLAVYATWADEYATDKGWTTLRHVFGDPERARQKAGVGEEARRKWYAKAAQELMEVGGQHPHPDAVKDRAATLLTMEEDRYGAASG